MLIAQGSRQRPVRLRRCSLRHCNRRALKRLPGKDPLVAVGRRRQDLRAGRRVRNVRPCSSGGRMMRDVFQASPPSGAASLVGDERRDETRRDEEHGAVVENRAKATSPAGRSTSVTSGR